MIRSARRVKGRRAGRRTAAWVAAGVLLVAAVLVLGAPRIVSWYLKARLLPSLSRKLAREIHVEALDVAWDKLTIRGLRVIGPHDQPSRPLLVLVKLTAVPSLLPLLSGRLHLPRVTAEGMQVNLMRRDRRDNYRDLLRRSKVKPRVRTATKRRWRVGELRVVSGGMHFEDPSQAIQLRAALSSARIQPGVRAEAHLRDLQLRLAVRDSAGGCASLAECLLRAASSDSKAVAPGQTSAAGLADAAVPILPPPVAIRRVDLKRSLSRPGQPVEIEVNGGALRMAPGLELTGIAGSVLAARRSKIRLSGSYGGARARLWSAEGWVEPESHSGKLRVEAQRFSLQRIASVLRLTPVIRPHRTLVGADVEVVAKSGRVAVSGKMRFDKLSLFHPKLSRHPILDLKLSTDVSAELDLAAKRFILRHLVLGLGKLTVQIDGQAQRREGSAVLDLHLRAGPLACQTVLDSIPVALVPELQGFKLRGTFKTDLRAHIDYARLEELTLEGRVGINRCRVRRAPPRVRAENLREPFEHIVEPVPGQEVKLAIGPESPDYAPYALVSPHVISAFLTTEDAGFFRHRGFIPSQFRSALARNLDRGGFRFGASTITMQLVKNVLLSHEKTLSRKLQELFLTWYLERRLDKQRLMEIYLNVIEFGPGIYGIGNASRRLFGKPPTDITPLEAAYLSTILPSPVRRYVHYCRGELSPKWDRYVRRVLRRMHAKGFVSDEAYQASAEQRVVFARDLSDPTPAACTQRLDDIVDSWQRATLQRLRSSVFRAAPEKLEVYAPPAE